MPGTLSVSLNSVRVGTISNITGDYNLFAFEDSYRENPSRPILSQGLLNVSGDPIRVVPRTHTVAPPFFSNLLPESDSLLRRIVARQFQIHSARDFPFLQTLGRDLPGAVLISGRSDDEEAEDPIAERLLPEERPLRFSLAGVQPKFSAAMMHDRLTIPLTGRGGKWIVKLPTNAYPRLPENERSVMELGRALGLNVPETRLVRLDDVEGLPGLPTLRAGEPRIAYAIRRFDRADDGKRMHYEDLNQVANQKPADKYENKTTQWIANAIATLCPPEDCDEFVRRLVFGTCIGNDDMHLKNWAISYPDGRNARIAPLYDFVCTKQYYPDGALALTIGGTRDFASIDLESIARMARAAEVSVRRAVAVAEETVDRLNELWPTYKSGIDNPDLISAIDRQLKTVPLARARKAAR